MNKRRSISDIARRRSGKLADCSENSHLTNPLQFIHKEMCKTILLIFMNHISLIPKAPLKIRDTTDFPKMK